MAVLKASPDKKSDAYAKNRADQLEKLAHLRGLEQRAVMPERRRPRLKSALLTRTIGWRVCWIRACRF